MVINIGSKFIRDGEILGIFDLDSTTVSKITRDFLTKAEKSGRVQTFSQEIPRTFVLSDEKVILTPVSVQTLGKRILPSNEK